MTRALGLIVVTVGLLWAAAGAFASASTVRLAYATGGNKSFPKVAIANGNGSDPHTLGTGDLPALSPNGASVAVAPEGGPTALLIYSPSGKVTGKYFNSKQVGAGTLAWSRDSRYLAVGLTDVNTVNKIGKSGVAIIDTKTGTTYMVAHGSVSGLSWSPNGDSVVFGLTSSPHFSGPYNLYTSGPNTITLHKITTNGRSLNPVWGKLGIAYDQSTNRGKNNAPAYQIFLMTGGHSTQITHVNPGPLESGLVPLDVSANGERMIAAFGGEDTDDTYTVDLKTHATHEVIIDKESPTGWGISRNGQELLIDVGGFENAVNTGKVESIPFGGGTPTLLVNHADFPSWNQ
jgi:hypothetical protein